MAVLPDLLAELEKATVSDAVIILSDSVLSVAQRPFVVRPVSNWQATPVGPRIVQRLEAIAGRTSSRVWLGRD